MRPATPRVLFVVNNPEFFLSHRLTLARDVQQNAVVEVAGPPGNGIETIEAHGFPYHTVPMSRTSVNPLRDLVTLAALARLFRARRPELVHLISLKPVIYGGIAARLTAVPATVAALTGLGYALTSRAIAARVIRVAVRPLLRAAVGNPRARVILQNDDDARALVRAVRACEPRVRVIRGSGVDPQQFRPRPEPEGDPVVLFAGRLLRDKGVDDFIEAARRLRNGGTRARFVIAGRPDPQNPTSVPEHRIAGEHAAGVVEWWGHRSDMPDVIGGSHVVCLPTTYGEGVPRVLIEAAASGRPIVATNWTGCREIVAHGRNGLLVEPGDIEALCGAIRRLVENPAERGAMGACGRELVLANFSAALVNRTTLAVYRELLRPAAPRLARVGVA
jgi:glycosyltransferase involved in cell wall biosynthesis